MSGFAIVDEARRHLGVREATGNNDGIPAALFMHGDRLPWCAGFALKVHEWAGVRTPGGYWPNRNVAAFEANCQRAKRWMPPTHTPEPGDCAFFSWRGESDAGPGGRHMGIVERVDALRGLVHCIEGNWRNAVERVTRELDSPDITGYARLWS